MAQGSDLPKNASNHPGVMPLPSPSARHQPGQLGLLLIGLTCLASGVALAAGRQLLVQLAPPLTPTTPAALITLSRHWSVDPERRREATLLLTAEPDTAPERRLRLLTSQGWGQSPLAAVSLKQTALAAEAIGQTSRATRLWEELLQRFPASPASADALYALGRSTPGLRKQLLQRFSAHPAALAAALDAGDAVHLARWGPRWPGAEPLLRRSCQRRQPALTALERQQLAGGLAQLGDGSAALRCLGQRSIGLPPALQLTLARALRQGDADQQRAAQEMLLALTRRHPASSEALEAAALLAEQPGQTVLPALQQLPAQLRMQAPVQARLAQEGLERWPGVLKRWPKDPASWDLQWELARRALLERQWRLASTVLSSVETRLLPPPLAARQLFWQGYSAQQQGQQQQARRLWQRLLRISPAGYYAWRAELRLGQPRQGHGDPLHGPELPWQPLASGDPDLDRLWRLGMPLEAWEQWRHQRGGQPPQTAAALQTEGRLRTAIGDDWTGLGQLEQASLRLEQTSCSGQWLREQQQHPRRFQPAFAAAAQASTLDPALLLAVARQESRFTPAVSSAVGAVGLLQLMPETAAELAGAPTSTAELQTPHRNAALGARYLRQLLDHWRGNPFLAVASYNAGAGAVQGWLGGNAPDVQREPELWTEAIPYPETRLYTKKVLGNLFTYQQGDRPAC